MTSLLSTLARCANTLTYHSVKLNKWNPKGRLVEVPGKVDMGGFKMSKNEIMLLIESALEVQSSSNAAYGKPYVRTEISNYCGTVNIEIIDGGFDTEKPFDGIYRFSINKPYSERMYSQCVSHLRELQNRMEGANRA